MSTKTYFKSPQEISLLSDACAIVVGALSRGRTGDLGTVTISASRLGYKIKLAGRLICAGSTPEELATAWELELAKAKRAKANRDRK